MNQQIELSNPATIRTYFEKVQELRRSGEQYPVDLDDVWPLVYAQKDKAVRALRKDFFENEDFVLLSQNGEQKRGGHNEKQYRISVACLEYFIARKVREVFEVYRSVFEQVVNQIEEPTTAVQISRKELALMVIQIEEEKEQLEKALALAKPKIDYVDEVLNTSECLVTTQIATELGYSAVKFNQILKERGIQWKVNDVWVLTAKYANKGYTQMRTHVQKLDNGEVHTRMNMVWTQRGRAMLHYLFKQERALAQAA